MGCSGLIYSRDKTQEQIIRHLHEKKSLYSLGPYRDFNAQVLTSVFCELVASQVRRKEMSVVGPDLIDACGKKRVLECLSGREHIPYEDGMSDRNEISIFG